MTLFVEFEPVGRRGPCPAGGTLLDHARHLGVDLANLCGGAGSCGRCIVQVLEGQVTPPSPDERDLLPAEKLAEGYRLACRTKALGDCRVRVPPESLTAPQRTQVEGEEIPVAPEPPVDSYVLRLPQPSLEDLRADSGRLVDALQEQHGVSTSSLDLATLQGLSPQLRAWDWQARAVLRDGELVALLPAAASPLGLAVDLGTTKIAAYLVDLASARTLASEGIMNPQISYGEDVIARLAYASYEPSQAARLQELVVEGLDDLAARLCGAADRDPASIVEAVVVGNTAMHHLLLRLPVAQLALAPYLPAAASALDIKARDLGLNLAPGAYVHLLPNIAGYVGADHVAMLLASGIDQASGVVLALDIGTNTEVCLAHHGRLTSLSCASGPAFEGAHIKHGMRAAPGAIERLRLVDGQIEYQTIGGAPPAGLCGSGILDTLAQLLLAGVVDYGGRMGDHPRVRGERGEREFVLVGQEDRPAQGNPGDGSQRPDITFTQKDVRELQLAKGAMRSGIDVLLKTNGLEAEQIDRVIIAGAFGTYIDVASAIAIDMLPALPLDRFRQVGNAAGMGAKLALISRSQRAAAAALARRINYVELATVPGFARTFAAATYLGRGERNSKP